MPPDIAKRYEELLKKVYDSAEYQEFMAKRGFDVTWMPSAEFAQFLKKETRTSARSSKRWSGE